MSRNALEPIRVPEIGRRHQQCHDAQTVNSSANDVARLPVSPTAKRQKMGQVRRHQGNVGRFQAPRPILPRPLRSQTGGFFFFLPLHMAGASLTPMRAKPSRTSPAFLRKLS